MIIERENLVSRLVAFGALMFLAAAGVASAVLLQVHNDLITTILFKDTTNISSGLAVALTVYAVSAPIVAFLFLRGTLSNQSLDSIVYLLNGVKITFVSVGLVGTVIGFSLSLSGVNPDSVSNAALVGPMVASLMEGMAIALTTTLVGTVAMIYAEFGNRLIVIVGQ